jgi:hypothetical protein
VDSQADTGVLEMETACFSETLVSNYLPTSHHGVATRRTTSSDKEWSEKIERSRAEQELLHMSEDERRNKKQTDTMPENEFNMA